MASEQFPGLPERQQAIKVVEAGKSLDMSPAPGSTFGCDVAGEVVAIGSKCCSNIKVGDRVFGPVKGNASDAPGNGGFAEYAAIRDIVAWNVPENMQLEQAAALGMPLMTVGLALHHMLKVPLPSHPSERAGTGEYVFIYGGGTATGTMAVQFAALSGMLPVVASSPRHFSRLKSLGAVACFDYHLATVADDIRDFTRNELRIALDCITDSASMSICYQALGSDGGRYLGLDQFPIRSHTRRDVRPDWIVAWTVSGEAIKWKRPYARGPRPKHKEFGQKWNPIAQGVLDAGLLRSHPLDVRSGGLAAVPRGIDELRKGLTDGRKLVYPIL
ncbi:alcohol dehydrogenase [Lecanosticta acicola]|uniref:Alcohol dehydrogenase n=1 Tax=Lecanosticta acicola TaxID=111012 RepID=A0AAI8YWB4_9PEZI|nr:alcohol dehydrogenase [Lecanosticta acicola]